MLYQYTEVANLTYLELKEIIKSNIEVSQKIYITNSFLRKIDDERVSQISIVRNLFGKYVVTKWLDYDYMKYSDMKEFTDKDMAADYAWQLYLELDYLCEIWAQKTNIVSVFERWEKEEKIAKELIKKIDFLLMDFATRIHKNKTDSTKVNEAIKQVVEEINIWNSKNSIIETEDAEIIIQYFYYILKFNDCMYDQNIVSRFRKW